MARERIPADEAFESDDRLKALFDDLSQKPWPALPPRVVRRVKAMLTGVPRRAGGEGPGLVGRAVEHIARLVFDSRVAPALAGFRGAASDVHLVYQSDLGEIDIQIQPLRRQAGEGGKGGEAVRLVGQVDCDLEAGVARLAGLDGGTMQEIPVDDRNMFAFEALPGRYDLTITLDGNAIRVPLLDF